MSRKTSVGVVFSLGAAETRMGDTMRVVGHGRELGDWNAENSVQLATDLRSYPRWSSPVIWIPTRADRETIVRYKYLRDRRETNGDLEWEDEISDRIVTLPAPDDAAATGTEHSPLTWVIGGLTQQLISVTGPLVWIIGDVGWNCAQTHPPCPLNMTGTPAYRPPSVMFSRDPSATSRNWSASACSEEGIVTTSYWAKGNDPPTPVRSCSATWFPPDSGLVTTAYWAEGLDPPTPNRGWHAEVMADSSVPPPRAHHADAKAHPVPPMRGRGPFADVAVSPEEAVLPAASSPTTGANPGYPFEQPERDGPPEHMNPFEQPERDGPPEHMHVSGGASTSEESEHYGPPEHEYVRGPPDVPAGGPPEHLRGPPDALAGDNLDNLSPDETSEHEYVRGPPEVFADGSLSPDENDEKTEHEKPPEQVRGPPEVFAGGNLSSPEWGNESCEGDPDIGIQDLSKAFTPSTRAPCKAAPESPIKTSPQSSSSRIHKLASSSLLPEDKNDSKPEQESAAAEGPEVMVREESASSLNYATRAASAGSLRPVGSDDRLRVEADAGCDGPMARSRSSSLLPHIFERAAEQAGGEPGIAGTPPPTFDGPTPTFEDVYSIVGEEPIGEGSFGLVWSCLPKTIVRGGDARLCAVKRISKRNLAQRDVRNLFGDDGVEGEIRMHFRLKHRHIVAMHEVFDDSSTVSLVMEVCRGGDLFDLITGHADKKDTGLPEVAAARVLRHLLRALKFLHSLHIVHRDVKCENVLLLEQGVSIEVGTYKLCDFGFAAEEKAETGRKLKSRLGSPDTVAPEVIKGEHYSTPVDCWAAGVLLFMALSATPPFWANSDIGVLQKVRAGQYHFSHVRWTRISDEAKDVVKSLLEYQPSDRASASQLLELPWVTARSPRS